MSLGESSNRIAALIATLKTNRDYVDTFIIFMTDCTFNFDCGCQMATVRRSLAKRGNRIDWEIDDVVIIVTMVLDICITFL